MTINTLIVEMVEQKPTRKREEDPKIRKAKDKLLVHILQDLLKNKS